MTKGGRIHKKPKQNTLDGSRADNVGPSPALSPSNEDQFDGKEGDWVREVLQISSCVPEWHFEDANLGEEIGDEDTSGSKHGPSAVDNLSLDHPLEELGVGSCWGGA